MAAEKAARFRSPLISDGVLAALITVSAAL
jgi:hypothetical protein